MAASLSQALPVIAFSKNPIWLKPQSTAYRAAAPATAINSLVFTGAIAAAAQIVLTWTDTAAIMTASAAPDDTGNQFPAGDGSWAYVQTLVPFYQANYFIDRDFVVTSNNAGANPRLIFTARDKGADYNFTGAAPLAVITAGVDDAPVNNFMFHIEVWIANLAGSFDKAIDANVPLDEPLTGITSMDIHEVLHSWLSQPGQYDAPVLATPYAQYTSSLRAYYVKYAEFFGAIPSIQKVKQSPTNYVAKGGLGMQNALLRDIVAELCPVTGDAAQNRFMRQGSKNKLISKDQPEWLSFINLTNVAVTINLEVIVYNSDMSQLTFNAAAGLVIQPYQKFQFKTGFTQLGITGRQSIALSPVYYQVRVKSTAGAYLTDTYNYVIDNQYREWPRFFVYENSYGAYQTIATVGKGQSDYDRIKTDAQLSTDRNTAAIAGDFLETNIFIQDKGIINIGYDRAGARNTVLLRDFILSHRIYLYDDGILIPIGLNTKNLKDAMDGVNVYANSIEYYPLYQEEVWTEPQPAVDDSLTGLLTEAGSAVPPSVPPVLTNSGTIIVEFGDPHLSVVGGNQVYTAPFWLAGKIGYRIFSTQMGEYFRTADIAYNSAAGSFAILVPGFLLNNGDQLIISPFVLNPDGL